MAAKFGVLAFRGAAKFALFYRDKQMPLVDAQLSLELLINDYVNTVQSVIELLLNCRK